MNRWIFRPIAMLMVAMMLSCGLAPAGAEDLSVAGVWNLYEVETGGARLSASALNIELVLTIREGAAATVLFGDAEEDATWVYEGGVLTVTTGGESLAFRLADGVLAAEADGMTMYLRRSAGDAKPSVRWPSRVEPGATDAPAATPVVTPAPAPAALRLQGHAGGFFEMDVPEGWEVSGNTRGTSHAVLARDPREPLRQVFYFSEMGPLYFSEAQRAIDRQVTAIGGQLPWYIDHPVVQPYTPSNFLQKFHVIMESGSSISQFIPGMAHLDNLEIISAQPMPSAIPGGARELIRAVFRQDGRAGQGLFVATLVSVLPENGTPFVGWGYALMFTGITAPFYEFGSLEEALSRSVASFELSEEYVNQCLSIQRSTAGAIIERGRILNETSDIIMESWTSRNQTEDVIAAKRSDAILGKERLYDPATGQVYEFDNGFYDQYNLDRNRYAMNNLQPLPGDQYELWTQAPRSGYEYLQ